MIYVDSNYWVYWLDARVPEHGRVTRTMRSAIREGVAISYITLFEVAHHLRMLPKDRFLELTDSMHNLATLSSYDVDDRIVDLALKMLPDYVPRGLGGRDCMILATMKVHDIKRIATHDLAFRNVPDIEVIDPIA